MKTLLTYMVGFLATINPALAAVTLGAISVVGVMNWLNQQWTVLLVKIDALSAASFSGTLSFEPMALVNTFMPLTEGLSYLTAWIGILGVCTVIRIIKSFVPTIAS